MPHLHKVDLIAQEVVAAELGVTSSAVTNWYDRQLPGLPKPVLIEGLPGKPVRKAWRRHQLVTWRTWHLKHLAKR